MSRPESADGAAELMRAINRLSVRKPTSTRAKLYSVWRNAAAVTSMASDSATWATTSERRRRPAPAAPRLSSTG